MNERNEPNNGSWVHSPAAEGEFLVEGTRRTNGDAMHHVEVIASRQELLLVHIVSRSTKPSNVSALSRGTPEPRRRRLQCLLDLTA